MGGVANFLGVCGDQVLRNFGGIPLFFLTEHKKIFGFCWEKTKIFDDWGVTPPAGPPLRLTLFKCSSNDIIYPLYDKAIDRFSFQILPKIHDNIK